MVSREEEFRWKWRAAVIAGQRVAADRGVVSMAWSREARWWEERAMLRRRTSL